MNRFEDVKESLSENVSRGVEKGKKGYTYFFFVLVFGFLCFTFGSMNGASSTAVVEDVCRPASPWISAENQRVTLEDGSTAYLRCGWVGDIVACPLPEEVPFWDAKLQAKWYEVRQHCMLIVRYAEEFGLDPIDFAALILQESGGWAGAESRVGAMGLTQVMPLHGCSSWDPEENIRCGASILGPLVASDGMRRGLAAYNAGVSGRDDSSLGYDFAEIVMSFQEALHSVRALATR